MYKKTKSVIIETEFISVLSIDLLIAKTFKRFFFGAYCILCNFSFFLISQHRISFFLLHCVTQLIKSADTRLNDM